MRRALPALLVAALGLLALGGATDGFRAFTSEQARRLEVLRRPTAPPPVVLQDQDGGFFRLSDYGGRIVLVDFVYIQCRSLCRVAGAQVQGLVRSLEDQGLADRTILVTISFDPARDTPEVLRAHGRKLGADPARWRVARPADPSRVAALLDAFGIVAIPDGRGEFQHNGAVHLLDRGGRLAAIFDYEAREDILRAVREHS
jgi:protein SCO1/2